MSFAKPKMKRHGARGRKNFFNVRDAPLRATAVANDVANISPPL
jgi:hypothetical protein